MSEPKRYAIRGFSAALVEEDNGVFIRYEDYARLKAEVERLTQECKGRQAENSVLAISLAEMKSYIALKNAAKDGKPSA